MKRAFGAFAGVGLGRAGEWGVDALKLRRDESAPLVLCGRGLGRAGEWGGMD